MDIISKYFPDLSPRQKEQFKMLGPLYAEWNQKINVVSRKDIDNIYPNHILHSLGIVKFTDFKDLIRDNRHWNWWRFPRNSIGNNVSKHALLACRQNW